MSDRRRLPILTECLAEFYSKWMRVAREPCAAVLDSRPWDKRRKLLRAAMVVRHFDELAQSDQLAFADIEPGMAGRETGFDAASDQVFQHLRRRDRDRFLQSYDLSALFDESGNRIARIHRSPSP